jgi:hypothetical protein
MSEVNTNNDHPALSNKEPKCPGKAIYSELNYEKLRDDRLQTIQSYYSKVLKKYEQNKTIYNQQFTTTAKVADNKEAELENKTGPNASNDEKLEGNETIKPLVIKLNKKLLEIATNVMNDNEHTGKGLLQQRQDLEKQEKELYKLLDNVSKLESNLEQEDNIQLTRNSRMESSYDAGQSSYYWYMGLVIINFILIVFLTIYMILLSQYN